ncbi:MAG: Cna domain protein [Bryobacterales bacterium]|nr:Cna domain protein [Bryobacterales bacterium]
MRYFKVAGKLCCMLSLSLLAFAQADKGTILGTVADTSQASIAGTSVRIVEIDTGFTRTVATNDAGNYTFPLLDPGSYRVEAEHQGFKRGIRDKIELTANSAARVDFSLEVGAVNESVTVSADAALLQTDRADIGQKIEAATLASLPLGNNRNYQNALVLVPGATRPYVAHSAFYDSAESLSTQVNGQDRHWNNFMIEGINNNWDNGNLTLLVPPVEAIQTVDTSTSNYDAEFGRVGGAVSNLILKSGTNNFHGSVFEFNKNSALSSRNFFLPKVLPLRYNQFGGSAGGPILKNKIFFFGDYQGSIDHSANGQNYTMPTMAYRGGDFTASPTQIYDPQSGTASGTNRTAFAGKIIPASRISPIARRLMDAMPAPTYPGLSANFAGAYYLQKHINSFDAKIEYHITPNDTLNVRYSYQTPVITLSPVYGSVIGGPGGGSAGAGFAGDGHARAQFPGISYVHIFNPTLIAQFRFGIGRIRNDATPSDYNVNQSQAFGIPGANLGDDWSSGIANMSVTGYDSPMIGYNASLPWVRSQTDFGFAGSVSKILGNHTIKAGTEINRERMDLDQTQTYSPRGLFTFTSGPTALNGDTASSSGMSNAFGSFLLDLPNQLGRDLNPVFPTRRNSWYFFYVSDKWQVNRKLTLDIGMRYEIWPATTTRFKGQLVDYVAETNTLLAGGFGKTPQNLGVSRSPRWVPRIGLAYRLNEKTVIRTGFGTSYLFQGTGTANYPASQAPVYTAPNSYSAAGSMAAGFPAPTYVQIPPDGVIPNAPVALGYTVAALKPHQQYIELWNLAVQRQLPGGFALDVAYVGNHGVNFNLNENINRGKVIGAGTAGQPFFATLGKTAAITQQYLYLTSRYNSLQVKLNKQMSHGLSATTSYTWAHGLDYNNDASSFNIYLVRTNYATGDFDRTHSFAQSFNWEMPFGKKGLWFRSGVGSWILGGWQASGVITDATGAPLDLSASATGLNLPTAINRPNQIAPLTYPKGVGPGTTWFSTASYVTPAALTFGNVGRNTVRGPGSFNVDISLSRRIPVTERIGIDFRFETFNTTNHPHFANPGRTLGTSTYGVVTSTITGDNRGVQMGAKLTF